VRKELAVVVSGTSLADDVMGLIFEILNKSAAVSTSRNKMLSSMLRIANDEYLSHTL
jgi:hypothetical protein